VTRARVVWGGAPFSRRRSRESALAQPSARGEIVSRNRTRTTRKSQREGACSTRRTRGLSPSWLVSRRPSERSCLTHSDGKDVASSSSSNSCQAPSSSTLRIASKVRCGLIPFLSQVGLDVRLANISAANRGCNRCSCSPEHALTLLAPVGAQRLRWEQSATGRRTRRHEQATFDFVTSPLPEDPQGPACFRVSPTAGVGAVCGVRSHDTGTGDRGVPAILDVLDDHPRCLGQLIRAAFMSCSRHPRGDREVASLSIMGLALPDPANRRSS